LVKRTLGHGINPDCYLCSILQHDEASSDTTPEALNIRLLMDIILRFTEKNWWERHSAILSIAPRANYNIYVFLLE
jgi:hypothetical protein